MMGGIAKSALNKKWQLSQNNPQLEQEFLRQNLDILSARILINRGANPDEIENILNPRLKNQMPDPFSILNMEKAILNIFEAIKKNQKIVIFADYDVDGATSAAILISFFEKLNTDISVFIPDRIKDGYGPNPQLMRSIKASGTDLLICVDCGAAAYEALNEAYAIGLDVIVFDHHLMNEQVPHALAIVNPNQIGDNSGLRNLTAAGVCFMAIVALNRHAKQIGYEIDYNPIDMLDLTALGTVCDVAPLTGLNRVFVAQGQKILGKLSRIGLAKLAQISSLKRADNVFACGFVLGPRLNAGGRIGDSSLATRLLLTNDEKEAAEIALKLEVLNQERRAIEQSIIDEAMEMALMPQNKDCQLLVLGKKGWHPGIIGIVAGRIKDKLNKPTIILGSINENDEILKGSGRSIEGVNLGGLIKNAVEKGILISGGGHKMAAGLACEFAKIDEIRLVLNEIIAHEAKTALLSQINIIDALISIESINIETLNKIEILGPFGAGWNEPRFMLANVRIIKADYLNGGHLRLFIKDEFENSLNAICFNAMNSQLGEILVSKQKCNLIIRIKKDDWRGQNAVSTEIIDAQYAIDAS